MESLFCSFPSCAEHDMYGLYLAADPAGAHTQPISTLNYISRTSVFLFLPSSL